MSLRSRIPVRPVACAAFALAGLVAVGLALPAGARTGSPGSVEVRTFRFRPATLEVAAGTKVVWRNRDQIEHTVTGKGEASATIDGTLPRAGARYAVRLDEPGTYEYFCARHPSMTGTVVVR